MSTPRAAGRRDSSVFLNTPLATFGSGRSVPAQAWKPNLQGIDYRHKSQAETNCCFDPTIIDVARDESSGGGLPRKEVSIILDHKCSLPAAIADHEGGPRYFPHGEYGRERERYPKKLPHHLR